MEMVDSFSISDRHRFDGIRYLSRKKDGKVILFVYCALGGDVECAEGGGRDFRLIRKM